MIQVTPDAANKLIRSYKDERRLLMEKERVDCTYSYLGTEQPYIPDYDFKQTQERLEVLSDKIIKIKHALNQFNMKTVSPATDMTIDEMLVRMAILSESKLRLERMRKMSPKSRRTYPGTSASEYTEVNFSLEEAEAAYKKTVDELTRIQQELNRININKTFKVDIDV